MQFSLSQTTYLSDPHMHSGSKVNLNVKLERLSIDCFDKTKYTLPTYGIGYFKEFYCILFINLGSLWMAKFVLLLQI